MACCLFNAKPLPKPTLSYCQHVRTKFSVVWKKIRILFFFKQPHLKISSSKLAAILLRHQYVNAFQHLYDGHMSCTLMLLRLFFHIEIFCIAKQVSSLLTHCQLSNDQVHTYCVTHMLKGNSSYLWELWHIIVDPLHWRFTSSTSESHLMASQNKIL